MKGSQSRALLLILLCLLTVSHAGTLALETVVTVDGGTWEYHEFVEPGKGLIEVAVDANGVVYAFTNWDGLYRYNGENWELMEGSLDPLWVFGLLVLLPQTDGTIWASNYGPRYYDGSEWTIYDGPRGRGNNFGHIRSIGYELVPYVDETLPPFDMTGSFVQAGDGSVWFASLYGGIARSAGGVNDPWLSVDTGGWGQSGSIGLVVAQDGSVWARVREGFIHFTEDEMQQYPIDFTAYGDFVREPGMIPQMAVTADGTVYSTMYFIYQGWDSLIGFDGTEHSIIDLSDMGFESISTFAGAPDGTIWVVAYAEDEHERNTYFSLLLHFDGQRWEQHPLPERAQIASMSIAIAPDGSVWVDGWNEPENRAVLLHYIPPES